jgi:two-component system, OmpR family, response regulator
VEADDYITKPFHIREVLLRIRAVLRRYEFELEVGAAPSNRDEHNERYEFEGGILDVPGRELKASNGATIELIGHPR